MVAQLDADYVRTRPLRAGSRLISHVLFQGRPLTTKWRWINSLLFFQFGVVKRLPQLKEVEKPIFVLGTGRSGTTILGKVLSLHPRVSFLNEPKALWHAIYPEEDVIGSYSRGPACYRLGEKQVTPGVKRAAHRLYGYCLTLTWSQRILDKYPEMIFRVPFIRAIFPDARFLFLVRNGWDTARSIESWSQRAGVRQRDEAHDWWGVDNRKWRLLVRDVVASDPALSEAQSAIANFTRHQDMAAVEWTTAMREGLRLSDSIPDAIHQVRFENLTLEPERTLKRLFAFCQLPGDATTLDYARRILSPPPPKPPFELHPAIRPVFLETMQKLDYPIGD